MALAVGVDGHAGGWVAIALLDGRFERAASEPTLAGIVSRFTDAAVFGVDIPIGLPDSGTRACDVAARRLLGPRRSSVFRAPSAAAGLAATPREARLIDRSLSAQGANLLGKIQEAAAIRDPRLREVHPELSFWRMAGRHLPHAKRTWAGQGDRLALLRAAGIELPRDLADAGAVPPDDVLDAAAAAWSAHRVAEGAAEFVGDALARIWY